MARKFTTLPYEEHDVAEGNYGVNRTPIDLIVLHSTAGTATSAIAWFGNSNAGTSAHYIIGNNGKLYAMLEETLVAYQAGNLAINNRSIGIEHEGYTGLVRSQAEYDTSVKLIADICKYYNIPCDRAHIIAHREIVQTACPTDLDVDRIVRDAYTLIHPPTPNPIIDLNWTDVQKKQLVSFVQKGPGSVEKWKIRDIFKIPYII